LNLPAIIQRPEQYSSRIFSCCCFLRFQASCILFQERTLLTSNFW
jgi:hypothetical protein